MDPNIIQNKIDSLEKELKILKRDLEDSTRMMKKCNKCNRWFKLDELAKGTYTETSTQTTFVDCGYGDDDKISEVTTTYYTVCCPKCGNILQKDSVVNEIKNERNRYE